MKKIKITCIIPAFGPVDVVEHSIGSFATQFLNDEDKQQVELECLLCNDEIDEPHKYDTLIEKYNSDNCVCKLINHIEEGKWYQGYARVHGCELTDADFVLFMDCDDKYEPFAVNTLLNSIREYEANKEKEGHSRQIACIGFDFLSFESHNYFNHIGRDNFSIWVQGRLWNRQFILDHNLQNLYNEGVNSKRAEDYPFVNLFDYYADHERDKWESIHLDVNTPALALWFPNVNSLSRCDPYYGELLSGYTMASSIAISEHEKAYNKEHGIEDSEDEKYKFDILNKTIYAWYNYLDFMATICATRHLEGEPNTPNGPYKPTVETWDLLRNSIKWMRKELLNYYAEIQFNDVVSQIEGVLHRSDCRVKNTLDQNFFDFMKSGDGRLNLTLDNLLERIKNIDFDGCNFSTSPQVQAWKKRHAKQIEEMEKKQAEQLAQQQEQAKQQLNLQ